MAIFGEFDGGRGKSGGHESSRIFVSLWVVVGIGVLVGFHEMDFWL